MNNFQSVLFNKNQYNLSQAKKWLDSHNYHPIKFHFTDNYIRARLSEPDQHRYRYRTKNLGNKIQAVVKYPLGSGVKNVYLKNVYPHHYERLLRPQKKGGNLLSFIVSNPNMINGLVGGIHALGSLAVLGGIGYAVKKKIKS